MIRGFYTSLAGLVAGGHRESVIADNIANLSTTGFKAGRSTQSDFGLELVNSLGGDLGRLGTATYPAGLTLDRTGGSTEVTGVPTDLAIEGDGLFTIRTAAGIAYSRAGDFVVDATGTLTTQQGDQVLDTTGTPIRAPSGTTAPVVNPDGSIGGTGRKLAIVAWPAEGLIRLGDNRYAISGTPVPATGVRIRQGALERSNVDIASEMTELIATQRSFALNARALAIQDGTLDVANQIGRVR